MSRRYSSLLIRRLQGAVHWLIDAKRHGRNQRQRSSASSMSRLQVRNLKTFCSACTAPRRLPALVNGPYSLVPLDFGSRVTSMRGKSSRVVISKYGNVLSSFSSLLNFG